MRAIKFNAMRLAGFALILAALAGCSGGAETTQNAAPPGSTPNVGYSGVNPPANDDVSAFMREFWTPLRGKTCASCHGTGGQSPQFMRDDDINLAHGQANPLVNRENPSLSVFVTKVAQGHNCWEAAASACADQISRWISAWVGGGGSIGNQIQLQAPELQDPHAARVFPSDPTLFEQHVWPLLTQNCSSCHTAASPTAQQPYFASANVMEAYDAARSKINIDQPAQSRLVLRLREESHNCWDVNNDGAADCAASANLMQAGIEAMQAGIPVDPFDTALVASKALRLVDGTVAAGGNRFDSNVIAMYEFKTGEGSVAYDTSGVEPALNLNIIGNDWEWVGGWGIRINEGKAQGTTAASRKLRDLIQLTSEYSIEAWVVPGNVAQEEARIVSYSGSATSRNFMLGQTLYSYDFYNRSTSTDQNGDPVLQTSDDDEDLQATLQHVVATYDPVNGRRIYVNGEYTEDADPVAGGALNEWDDTFAFVLGNEVSNNRQFQGTFRLVAIHNRALTEAQVVQNFEAGVGEKFYLLFNISEHVNVENAYVLFEVSQYDSYAYLFDNPRFYILGDGATLATSFPIRGMRIGVNGQVPTVGQAYRTIDVTVDGASYTPGEGQSLSNVGTVIGLERGPDEDQFFLSFEVLGSSTDVRVEADPEPAAWPPATPRPPTIGLRTFERIHATMAKLTGVNPQSSQAVRDTYEQVKQGMPTVDSIETFVSAQPVAITQLAIQYCSALIDDPTARAAYFPGFNFNAAPGTAYAGNAAKDLLLDPLLQNMVGNLANQPTYVNMKNGVPADQPGNPAHPGLYNLIDRLAAGGGNATRTQQIAKATCATVLGSAATLIN